MKKKEKEAIDNYLDSIKSKDANENAFYCQQDVYNRYCERRVKPIEVIAIIAVIVVLIATLYICVSNNPMLTVVSYENKEASNGKAENERCNHLECDCFRYQHGCLEF